MTADGPLAERPQGEAIIRASWWGTAAFGAVSAAAVIVSALRPVALVFDTALFAAGVAAFVWSYAKVLGRSRKEQIGVTGVYLLTDQAAPPRVRRTLLTALGVQVAVGLTAAAIRPYTGLAAGTLAPVYGLGLCGVWAARHGRFPPRGATTGRAGGGDG